jgi:hypothetical protein
MSNSVFTTSFLDRVTAALDTNCPVGTGQCITRTNLATELGLDPKMRLESALGALVTSGEVAGYEIRKGPQGGIGRVGERRARKPSTPSTPELTDEFKGKLMAALQTLCDSVGTPVPRKDIAAYIDNEKAMPMISAALHLDEFEEFETKIGKGGGVRRIVEAPAAEAEDEIEATSSDETEAVEADDDVEPVTDRQPESNLGEDLAASMEESVSDESDTEVAEAAV